LTASYINANNQVEKKDKHEADEPEADAAADASVADDAASERVLSRREEKAPARDQPTTGETTSHSAGEGLDETPDMGEVPRAPSMTTDSAGQAPVEAPPSTTEKSSGGMFSRFTETLKK
jgi:hypothetical protein